MVPPSGFVIVSLNVDTGAAASTASNVAPQVRGPAMDVRPVGAHSPVYPLHTYPLSGVLESSIGSPVVIMAEHLVPWLPHSIPGPIIVPPVGLVIVNNWPVGQTHRTAANNPQTSSAPTRTVPTASSAPRAVGVAIADPEERGARRVRLSRRCNRSPSDRNQAPREKDDFGGRGGLVRGFACPIMVGSETGRVLVRGGGSGGKATRGSVSDERYRGSSRRTITVGSIDSGADVGPLARLMRMVGSVETTSEPSAGV
jgi:hypothetical protein